MSGILSLKAIRRNEACVCCDQYNGRVEQRWDPARRASGEESRPSFRWEFNYSPKRPLFNAWTNVVILLGIYSHDSTLSRALMAGNEIFNNLNLVLQLNQHIQAVSDGARLHPPASSPTGALTKQTSFNVLTNLKSVSYLESREDAQFDHQRSIFLSVSSSDLPFHLQGDIDFNEASAMAKRRALRFSESIKARIEFLWQVAGGKKQAEMAQRIRQQQKEEDEQTRVRRGQQSVRRTAASDIKQILPSVEELDEEDYMALMLLIFKVLRDDFVLEIAQKQIQCDWEVDSHHGKSLSFDQFFAAVFELVDVWTCDMEETTYERFLHLLAKRITRRVAVFLDGAELKLSLSDNFEPEVIVKAIPLRTVPKFASVARVVAAVGMKTVGDLARADPKLVERERIDFIQRNNGGVVPEGFSETQKIGQDLQTLIEMFKSIALQFENLNYTLENNVLRRAPTAAGPRPKPGEKKSGIVSGTDIVDRNHLEHIASNGEDCADSKLDGDTRVLGNTLVGGKIAAMNGGRNYQSSSSKSGAGIRQAQAISSSGKMSSSFRGDSKHQGFVPDGNFVTTHSSENTRPSKRSASMTDSTKNSSQSIARGTGEGSADYFQPINNIYDLQNADASVVNVLRSTFLIEKAISIQRQTDLAAIQSELVKFGIELDVTRLPEEAARDRYNALYDLLVLRDGESLKALAAVMLEQIKFELSIHGIVVDDEEDVEEVYDGFFTSVVTGTGDSIVQDAQRWMENTIQDNKINDYIQHDFHELNSVDEVKLLGTSREDEEFLALLPKDDDTEAEVVENTSKHVDRKNTSPIQRKSSLVAAVTISPPEEKQSSSPIPIEDLSPYVPLEQVVIPVRDDTYNDRCEKKKKPQKKKSDREKAMQTPISTTPAQSTAPVPVPSSPVQSSLPIENNQSAGPGGNHKEKSIATIRKPKLTISTQVTTPTNTKPDERANLGPPIEATSSATPDDGKRIRQMPPPRIGHQKADVEMDAIQAEKSHHDSSDLHTARDALNVAIEFEEDDTTPGAPRSKVDGERPISMEPKVPKIVIGGSSTATNVPVTGRYIQLLGLGNVLITKIERDFFQLLQSQETDLVCFDIGTDLDTALTKLETIQRWVGNRVILFGGSADEPVKTQQIALECLAHGALYFATIPFDFPRLREKVMSYFENSKQPYILRQRKPPGQTAQVGSSIGSGSLFALHDEPRKVSTSVAFAKTPRRKLAVAVSALPSLSSRETSQPLPYGSSETRRADFAPIAPSTPRSSQSRNRSPRLSTTMNKLIR